MGKRSVYLCLAITSLAILARGGQALGADCGEPVPVPKYHVSEKWTWKDEKGRESTDEVVQVEGDITQIRWSNGDIAHYDKDRIIQKVVRSNGEVVTKQGSGAYVTIGQKTMDFPLQAGKKWEFDFVAQPRSGLGTMQTYTNRYKVLPCEEASTPAGKFLAFKLEMESSVQGGRYSGILYLWYAPQVKNYVKRQYVPSQWWGGGRFLDNELIKFEVKQ